jgi:hypothetical protein
MSECLHEEVILSKRGGLRLCGQCGAHGVEYGGWSESPFGADRRIATLTARIAVLNTEVARLREEVSRAQEVASSAEAGEEDQRLRAEQAERHAESMTKVDALADQLIDVQDRQWQAMVRRAEAAERDSTALAAEVVSLRDHWTKERIESERFDKKWRDYETNYILPVFDWAKEMGVDLPKLVSEHAGKNCVELLFGVVRANHLRAELRADACTSAHAETVYALDTAIARIERAERERDEALHWEDVDDEWTQAVKAAHPTRSDSHDQYAMAMKMVGHRHSKGELVSLVNWLLVERDVEHTRLVLLGPLVEQRDEANRQRDVAHAAMHETNVAYRAAELRVDALTEAMRGAMPYLGSINSRDAGASFQRCRAALSHEEVPWEANTTRTAT